MRQAALSIAFLLRVQFMFARAGARGGEAAGGTPVAEQPSPPVVTPAATPGEIENLRRRVEDLEARAAASDAARVAPGDPAEAKVKIPDVPTTRSETAEFDAPTTGPGEES